MNQSDFQVFSSLYRQAFLKCFKEDLRQPIAETEAKIFYQQVLDQTGLIIGWRSLKNYSFFVLGKHGEKQENPSVASMDTLARYVLQAPYTDEANRKKDEAHHPYWFLFREKNITAPVRRRTEWAKAALFIVAALLVAGIATWVLKKDNTGLFTDSFHDLSPAAIKSAGWVLQRPDSASWSRRNVHPDRLTLYTLMGDNWPDSIHQPHIFNLLIRPLTADCFTAEIQLENFIPAADWQQAGLLLLEDTSLSGPSIRISLAYNDYFGGFRHPGEVLVQSIYSAGHDQKPEEFIHLPLVTTDSLTANAELKGNLQNTALRIEKNGHQFHFLYAGGVFANGAFRELAVKEFYFSPKYIALFAFKGWHENSPVLPVVMRRFSLARRSCGN